METFWDLHIAFVRESEKLNWANDIDPHHHPMEFHHILPQCRFGDQPIGAWLTLRQHAIASCLQSIALKKVCFFSGTHKEFVPEWLWEMTCEATEKEVEAARMKGILTQMEKGLGIHTRDEELRREWARQGGNKMKREKLGFFALSPEQEKKRVENLTAAQRAKSPEVLARASRLGGAAAMSEKNEDGKSIHARKMALTLFEDPNHPELGHQCAGNLVRMQMRRGLPHGKENRRRVK